MVSNQRPRITFNDDGICSACLWTEFKRTVIDWDKKEKELEEVCDKFRSKDGSWDIIIPGSGGKDSGHVSYIMKKKFGMHPLTVTWASALNTEIGTENVRAPRLKLAGEERKRVVNIIQSALKARPTLAQY